MAEAAPAQRWRFNPLPAREGWIPYAWLIYVAGLFFPLIFGSPAPRDWALCFLYITIFLPLYFAGYWLHGSKLGIIVLIFFCMSVAGARWNPATSTFSIYAAAFIGHTGGTRVAARWLAVLVAAVALASWMLHASPAFWIPALIFTPLIGAITIERARSHRVHRRLEIAQDEVARLAKMAERERIARDLHDLLGHTLSVVILKSELASRLVDRDVPRAAQEIRDVERIAREALTQVRAAVAGYRSTGIKAELENAREALEAAGVALACDIEPMKASAALESVIALAIREAITNIVRHAEATNSEITLHRHANMWELSIRDNGRGGALAEGSGLSGMRERVEALGGTFERDNSRGTRLLIRLPLESSHASGAA